MINFRLSLTGTAPLLMHNGRLANPLEPAAKAQKRAADKRQKSDEDHLELARLEFLGSLYIDESIGPYIPNQNIVRSLLDAARLSKKGKTIERGLYMPGEDPPLVYPGPRTGDELWADENFRYYATVRLGAKRVVRTRPFFRVWRVEVDGMIDPTQLDLDDLQHIATIAGQLIGLGDWRPKFGRYEAEVEQL